MAITVAVFTGSPVAMTDGKTKVTFDTPSDFEDWQEEHYGERLAGWHWCQA